MQQVPAINGLDACAEAAAALGLYAVSPSSSPLYDLLPQLAHLVSLHALFVALGVYSITVQAHSFGQQLRAQRGALHPAGRSSRCAMGLPRCI